MSTQTESNSDTKEAEREALKSKRREVNPESVIGDTYTDKHGTGCLITHADDQITVLREETKRQTDDRNVHRYMSTTDFVAQLEAGFFEPVETGEVDVPEPEIHRKRPDINAEETVESKNAGDEADSEDSSTPDDDAGMNGTLDEIEKGEMETSMPEYEPESESGEEDEANTPTEGDEPESVSDSDNNTPAEWGDTEGIGEKTEDNLHDAGFTRPEDIQQATREDLADVPYMSPAKAETLIEACIEPESWRDVGGVGSKTESKLHEAGFLTKTQVRQADREELAEVDNLGEKGLDQLLEYVSP